MVIVLGSFEDAKAYSLTRAATAYQIRKDIFEDFDYKRATERLKTKAIPTAAQKKQGKSTKKLALIKKKSSDSRGETTADFNEYLTQQSSSLETADTPEKSNDDDLHIPRMFLQVQLTGMIFKMCKSKVYHTLLLIILFTDLPKEILATYKNSETMDQGCDNEIMDQGCGSGIPDQSSSTGVVSQNTGIIEQPSATGNNNCSILH